MNEQTKKEVKVADMHNEIMQNHPQQAKEIFGLSLEQPSFLKVVDSSSSCHSGSLKEHLTEKPDY
jgi:hypothetical protein